MLSNTAVPKYYGRFREAVIRGQIPVCREIEMEMNRIDELILNPGVYYDDEAVDGWIRFCEQELTLTDGSPLHLLDSFKLWGEQVFGWYYFVHRSIYEPYEDRAGGHYGSGVFPAVFQYASSCRRSCCQRRVLSSGSAQAQHSA